jgi:hypothetical protein
VSDACRALDGLEAEYEAIARRVGAATWAAYVGPAEGEEAEDPAAVRAEFGPLIDRAAPLVDGCAPAGDDPVLARRLAVWRRVAAAWRVDAGPEAVRLRTGIEERVNDFAFQRDGVRYTRSDLSLLARSADAAQRRLAVDLRGDLHRAVLEDTRRLVDLRRAAAAALGDATYADALLAAQDVPPAVLDPLLADLERRTRAPWEAILRRGREAAGLAPDAGLAPWDLQWLIEQLGTTPDDRWPKERALPALTEALAGIGIDLAAVPLRRVEGDFGYGGQTLAVSIPDDVRMMINPLPGWRTWGILFHETGHALQAAFTEVRHPMLKGYEWLAGASAPAWSEGMAGLCGLLVADRGFLERRTDLSAEEIDRFLGLWRARSLLSLRVHLADIALERALYAGEADIDALERELAGRFLGAERPADAPPTWAATAFLSAYPCYMQDYVLADLIATQIWEALRARFGAGALDNAEVGPFLARTLWADGETREWTARVRDATGRDLDADAYLRFLGLDEDDE